MKFVKTAIGYRYATQKAGKMCVHTQHTNGDKPISKSQALDWTQQLK